MPFSYKIRTRYTDAAQDGIIHHSSFVIYLEVARLEFLKKLGCDINELEKKKILCPVVDLSLKYMKPLYSLEDIEVDVWLRTFSKVRFCLNYQIRRKGICAATGSTTHCFINENFKPIAIPNEILEAFKKY